MKQGFTFIELVASAVIISVFAGAIVPMAYSVISYRKEKLTEKAVSEIKTGVTNYLEDTGGFPSSLTWLIWNPGVSGWKGPYVSLSRDEVEKDGWGENYIWTTASTQSTILSKGQDKAQNTSDDISETIYTGVYQYDRREETKTNLKRIKRILEEYYQRRCWETRCCNEAGCTPQECSNFFGDADSNGDFNIDSGFGIPSGYLQDAWGSTFIYSSFYDNTAGTYPPYESCIYSINVLPPSYPPGCNAAAFQSPTNAGEARTCCSIAPLKEVAGGVCQRIKCNRVCSSTGTYTISAYNIPSRLGVNINTVLNLTRLSDGLIDSCDDNETCSLAGSPCEATMTVDGDVSGFMDVFCAIQTTRKSYK